MGLSTLARQTASNAVAGQGSWISLHTAAGGGTTGANEASGGGYARQQTTWPASAASMTGSAVLIPAAAATYTEFGIWSAVTTGNFVASTAFTGGNVVITGTGASVTVTPTIAT